VGELARVAASALVLLEGEADAGGSGRGSLGLVARGRSSAASAGGACGFRLVGSGRGRGGSRGVATGSGRILLLGRAIAANAAMVGILSE
jgi:hypothetical protein